MRNQFIKKTALTLMAMALAGAAFAQGPQGGGPGGGGRGAGAPGGGAPGGGGRGPGGPGGGGAPGGGGGAARGGAPAGGGSTVSANPTYVSITMEVAVNKPAAEVWARVGKYCDIGEWFGMACTLLSGKDGEIGAVRSVANEILVAKTDLSYTYTQPVREGRPYDLYHGTLEAKPVTATTSKLVYTLMWDSSTVNGDKEADKERRRAQFQGALDNMKTLAEGGTMPARGGGRGGPGGGAGAPGGGRGGPGGGAGGPGGGRGGPGGGAGGPGGGRGPGAGGPPGGN